MKEISTALAVIVMSFKYRWTTIYLIKLESLYNFLKEKHMKCHYLKVPTLC